MTDLIDRWCELRELGVYTIDSAAVRLGVDRDTLRTALRRAHKRGDPRVPAMPRRTLTVIGDDLNTSTLTNTAIRTHPAERAQAVIAVAARARDAADLRQLLDALGLDPREAT